MAIPSTAFKWSRSMDPTDLVDYEVDLAGILEEGEVIGSYTLSVLSEGVLLGFNIESANGYSPQLIDNTRVKMWFSITDSERSNPLFNSGVSIPIELTINTTSSPSRRLQRTLVVTVVQQ